MAERSRGEQFINPANLPGDRMAASKKSAKRSSGKKRPAAKRSRSKKPAGKAKAAASKRRSRKASKPSGGLDTVRQVGEKTWKTLKSTTAQVVEGVKETFGG
jgi:hypothetical protein